MSLFVLCLFFLNCGGTAQSTNSATTSLRQCAIPSGYQVCTKTESGICSEWGEAQACDAGETCSNGTCSATCTNECSEGTKQCTLTGYQECGNFDDDDCLDWGTNNLCETNESCSLGECHPLGECSDECEANATKCTVAEDGFQTCGNYDADTCSDWGIVTLCSGEEVCINGTCDMPCSCHNNENICEALFPDSSAKCDCDPDCSGKQACSSDGYCDPWCPAGEDPDCLACACNTNPYCEASENESTETCSCDLDCNPHGQACSADGHCDLFCDPEGINTDPDCEACAPTCTEEFKNCSPQFIALAWYYGNEMDLYGSYENPDPVEEGNWVQLNDEYVNNGSAQHWFQFPVELLECVTNIKISVLGYDDSFWGAGASVRIYNMLTYSYDLLSVSVGSDFDIYINYVSNIDAYTLCGDTYCYILASLQASDYGVTHLGYMSVYIYLSEP